MVFVAEEWKKCSHKHNNQNTRTFGDQEQQVIDADLFHRKNVQVDKESKPTEEVIFEGHP